MRQINSTELGQIHDLFKPLEHHLLIRSLFNGGLIANILCDEGSQPSAGLIAYNNRFIFGGDPQNRSFNKDLFDHFHGTILPMRKGEGFLATFTSDTWLDTLNEMFNGCELITAPRLYFEAAPAKDYEALLPEGFSIQHVTQEFMNSDTKGLEALREEMCSERTSVDDFLSKSFGLCPTYENQLAGWCLSEYNTSHACEIGIATFEPHQRKGVATTITKAFLAEAARRGYQKVGWDCWERNQASVATARKAGFSQIHREQAMVVILK